MRYQAFLSLSILSLVACSGDPVVTANGEALHSKDPTSFPAGFGTGSGGGGANEAGTGAGGSDGPVMTGSGGSGAPVMTGSGGSDGCVMTGSGGSGGAVMTGSGGSGGQAVEAAVCGNGFCEDGETSISCATDCCEASATGACVPVCGNGFCEDGEDATCGSDCP